MDTMHAIPSLAPVLPSAPISAPAVRLGSAGSIEAYVRSVQQQPMLSAEDEVALALRFRTLNDLDAARQLVLSHLRFVVSLSRQYLGYGLPQADLIQEGTVGLMKAVKAFDPSRGVRLVSFAVHWIKSEIHDYILRNWQLVKIASTKAQRKLFFNLKGLKRSLGADRQLSMAQAEAIAQELSVSPAEVLEMDQRLAGGDLPLELPEGDAEDTPRLSWSQRLAADHADPAELVEASVDGSRRRIALQAALQELDARTREILEARWMAEPEQVPTLHALADKYGVSAERIRQLEANGLKKLRLSLA